MDVTVLTPSYNSGNFIEDNILSVCKQEHVSRQHVVQDAVSTDRTTEVVARYRRYVEWYSEADNGQSDALNRARERATGEWLGWLNADEFYLPGALETLLSAGRSAGADVVFGDVAFVDEKGNLLRLLPQHRMWRLVLRWYGPTLSNCGALFRSASFDTRNFCDERLRRIMDWDLYLGLIERRGSFVYIPTPVAAFRIHGDQVTAAPRSLHASEYSLVRQKYRIPALPLGFTRRTGRVLHGLAKLSSGAYLRAFRARRLRGADLRWFASETAADNTQALRRACTARRLTGRLPSI